MANVRGIVDKLTSVDKDLRYMAASDLLKLLQSGSYPKADPATEEKLCTQIVKSVRDPSSDVSSLADKCLAPLAATLTEDQIRALISALCHGSAENGKGAAARQAKGEILFSGTSLKRMVADLPLGATAKIFVDESVPGLTALLQGPSDDAASRYDCLDVVNEMAKKFFPSHMPKGVEPLVRSLMALLSSKDAIAKKKAIQCLASLCWQLSPSLADEVCSQIQTMLEACGSKGPLQKKASINAVATLIQSVGQSPSNSGGGAGAMGGGGGGRQAAPAYMKTLVQCIPTLVSLCEACSEESEDDEVREASLHAFEMFVRHAPFYIQTHAPQMLSLALKYISYDPNFAYEEEEEEEEEGEEGEGDGEGDGEGEGDGWEENGGEGEEGASDDDGFDEDDDDFDDYSDDEDTSWKVRKASARCLLAITQSCPSLLPTVAKDAYGVLIGRLNEREQNVQVDVIVALVSEPTSLSLPLPSLPFSLSLPLPFSPSLSFSFFLACKRLTAIVPVHWRPSPPL